MTASLNDLRQRFVSNFPLSNELGLTLEACDRGEAWMRLPYRKDLIGEPRSGVLHGGAISALLETTFAVAVHAFPDFLNEAATMDMRVNYMRPARPGSMVMAHGKVKHVTRRIIFVEGSAWDEDDADPMATAAGTFAILAMKGAA